MWTREQVIASIDAKTNTFFVIDPFSGKPADIVWVLPKLADHSARAARLPGAGTGRLSAAVRLGSPVLAVGRSWAWSAWADFTIDKICYQ